MKLGIVGNGMIVKTVLHELEKQTLKVQRCGAEVKKEESR